MTTSQVYSNIGQKVFIDFVYDLAINTLDQSEEMPCSNNMNDNFDDTLYERINEMLENEFNCTVPFLPPTKSKLRGNDTEICQNLSTGADANEQYN